MTEILEKVLESFMTNNGFCNTISHQMACVNTNFYNINIKKNKHSYLKRTKDIQDIIFKLAFIEDLTLSKDYSIVSDKFLLELGTELDKLLPPDIIKDIALTFYCFDVYTSEYNINNIIRRYNFPNDNIKILYWKKDEIPVDFIFEFSFNLWRKINSTLIFTYPSSYENFVHSLSSVFETEYYNYKIKHYIASIFTDMRYTNYMISKTEYRKGKHFIIKLLGHVNKNFFRSDKVDISL